MFQSTYLYKVRLTDLYLRPFLVCFNPRTYIRYDIASLCNANILARFNPRTYIRYDHIISVSYIFNILFQSTYLYKVRPSLTSFFGSPFLFQSTYLYKVRQFVCFHIITPTGFNPRTYIRYDNMMRVSLYDNGVSIHVPI